MTDKNQGEGDKISAEKYNKDLRSYIANSNVDDAARRARDFVETQPDLAAQAERKAKRGPRSWLARTLANVRAVLTRK
ncbi:MAG: hypothetical protein ABI591_32885 [Kofleriaceae bacterium]